MHCSVGFLETVIASDKTSFLRQTSHSPSFPALHTISAIGTKLNFHHPASQHGLRATGKMFLLTQVLSSSRIESTSKHTPARWELRYDIWHGHILSFSVCAAVAKESGKIPHLCKDAVVNSNQCETGGRGMNYYTMACFWYIQRFLVGSHLEFYYGLCDTLKCLLRYSFGDCKIV